MFHDGLYFTTVTLKLIEVTFSSLNVSITAQAKKLLRKAGQTSKDENNTLQSEYFFIHDTTTALIDVLLPRLQQPSTMI